MGGTRENVYSGTVMAVACGTHIFTNTAGRQCPWTSCIYIEREREKVVLLEAYHKR